MTREHAKELLPIITAYAEGKTIQIDDINIGWSDAVAPSFTQAAKNYRIKPEPDPYAELKAAHAAGKVIQIRGSATGVWEDSNTELTWSLPVKQYRIKPEPKLVPLTSDDLPPVVWVRKITSPDFQILVLAFHQDDGSFWTGESSDYHHEPDTHPLWEWSPDRKTWHSFMKEVEA